MVRVYIGTQAIAIGLAGLIEVLKEKYFFKSGTKWLEEEACDEHIVLFMTF